MPLKYIKASLPHLNFLTKTILMIAILAMTAVGALSNALHDGPMDLVRFKPFIEKALSDQSAEYDVVIGGLALKWPRITEPFLLDMKNVQIIKQDQVVSSVDDLGIGVSTRHLLFGNVKPAIVILKGPIFELVQTESGYKFFWQDLLDDKVTTVSNVEIYQDKICQAMNPTGQAEEKPYDFFIKAVEQSKDEQRQDKLAPLPADRPFEGTTPLKALAQILEQIFNPEGTDFAVLSALKRIELKDVVLKSRQVGESSAQFLALIDLSMKKNRAGLQGVVNASLPSKNGKKSEVKSDVAYREAQKDLTFTATIKDLNLVDFEAFFPEASALKEQSLLLNGKVQAAFDEQFELQFAMLDLNVPEGQLNLPQAYDAPLSLKDVIVKATLNRPAESLNISDFRAVIGDVPIKGNVQATLGENEISAPIILKIADVKPEQIGALVPKSMHGDAAGQWLRERLKDGRFFDVVASSNINVKRNQGTAERVIEVTDTRADFKAEGLSVIYSSTLMPVKNASAVGSYADDILSIKGDKGMIGDVAGTNVDLKLTNLSVAGGGMAYLTLSGNGPFKTVLKYASDEPIGLGDTVGFDINTVRGNINFDLDMEFPTIKDLPKEDVKVKITGKLTDAVVPNIVQGLPLTGGPYDLSFSDGAIALSGKGKLANRDIEVSWKEYLDAAGKEFESKITAKIIADAGLRKAFGIGLEDYISGPIPIDVTYIDRGVKATVDVKGTLSPTTIHIDPFDYKKAAGVAGELMLKAHMRGDTLEEVDNLALKTEGLNLSGGRLIFKKLKDGSTDIARGTIPNVTLGKTQTSVDFELTPNDVLKVIAKGSVVDIVPFIKTDKKASKSITDAVAVKKKTQAVNVSLKAQKLLMQDGESLSAATVYLETDKQGDMTRIELDAKVANSDLYLRFKPEAGTGKRTFRLESSDAGSTLKAFGLTDKVRGGKMTIYGQPRQGDNKGDLYGEALIENFKVRKAPALAKLLNIMSLQGVQSLLNNDGLAFTKLESDFEWQFRDLGNLLIVKDGRTSGSSLGLTFEGLLNMKANTTDISGTVIPLSGVNEAIGTIPILGQILTGGGALLAATYTMKGPSSDPSVSVNPLSVLAPGFLRKILFEENVDTKVRKESGKASNDNVPKAVQQPVVTAPNINANN